MVHLITPQGGQFKALLEKYSNVLTCFSKNCGKYLNLKTGNVNRCACIGVKLDGSVYALKNRSVVHQLHFDNMDPYTLYGRPMVEDPFEIKVFNKNWGKALNEYNSVHPLNGFIAYCIINEKQS